MIATRTKPEPGRRRFVSTGSSTTFFLTPILLTSFVCTAVRNVRGRTGGGTRVRLNARTTGAVHSHSHTQYDIPAPLLPYESQDSTGCVLLLLVSFAPCGFYAVHVHTLLLLFILVPYMCDVSRLVSMLLYHPILYRCTRSPCLVGLFPFQPAYIVVSLSTVYVLFGIILFDASLQQVWLAPRSVSFS